MNEAAPSGGTGAAAPRTDRITVRPASIGLPLVSILVGAGCIYLHLGLGAGRVWVAGGTFFITVGIAAFVLTLAWSLPESPARTFLRSWLVSVIIVASILVTLVWTVYLGVRATFFGR